MILSYKMHYVNFGLSMCNDSDRMFICGYGGGIPRTWPAPVKVDVSPRVSKKIKRSFLHAPVD